MTDYAKHYNDAIYSQLEHDVDKFIEDRPQPTMLYTPPLVETPKHRGLRGGGSKGGQRFVLTSGSLPYDYPSSLAVGSAKKPTSMAKEFYGEPDLISNPFAYGKPNPRLVGGRIGLGAHKNVLEHRSDDRDMYSGGSLLRAKMPLGYDTQYPMGGNHLDGSGFWNKLKDTVKKITDDPRVRELADKALEAGIKKGVDMGNEQLKGMGMSGGYHCSMEGCGFWDSIKGAVGKIANDERVKKLADDAFKKGVEMGTDYVKENMKSSKSGGMVSSAVWRPLPSKSKFLSLHPEIQEQIYHNHIMSGGKVPKWLSDIGKFFGKIGNKVVNDERVRDLADNALDKAIQKGTDYGNQQLAGMGRMTKEKFHSLPRHIQEKYYHHRRMKGGKMPKWLSDIGKFFGKIGNKVVNDERVRDLADNALDKAIQKGTDYGNQQLAGMGMSGGWSLNLGRKAKRLGKKIKKVGKKIGNFVVGDMSKPKEEVEEVEEVEEPANGGKMPIWLSDLVQKQKRLTSPPPPHPWNDYNRGGKFNLNHWAKRNLADGLARKGGSILEDSMPYSHAILPRHLAKPPFKGRSKTARSMKAPLTAYSQSSAIYGAGRSKSARGALISKIMRQKGIPLGEASRYIKEHGLM